MNPAFHLFQLQKIDTHLKQLDSRLTDINKAIQDDSSVQNYQRLLDQCTLESALLREQLQSVEEIIQSKRNKIEQSESSLYAGKISNPKELQDIQKEIASIKLSISALEERQLELMFENENAEINVKNASSELFLSKTRFETNNQSLLTERNTLETEKVRLFNERSVVISQLSQKAIEVYDLLRTRKNGVAVARVEDQTCSLCGATLTPAEYQVAKSKPEFFFCPSCGRILYAD